MNWDGPDRRKESTLEVQINSLRSDLLHKIDEIAEKSVYRTLGAFGFDTKDPLKTQQDMAHLRRTRLRSEGTFNRAWYAVVAAAALAGWNYVTRK